MSLQCVIDFHAAIPSAEDEGTLAGPRDAHQPHQKQWIN